MAETTPQMAAKAWADAHASRFVDPVEFGNKVAQVEASARLTAHHKGDAVATAAALAALSIRPEVLQAISQLASLCPPPAALMAEQNQSGAEA